MGEGLTRVARICGGLTVTQGNISVSYVPKPKGSIAELLRERAKRGWQYIGEDEDGEFLMFERINKPVSGD